MLIYRLKVKGWEKHFMVTLTKLKLGWLYKDQTKPVSEQIILPELKKCMK